VYGETVNQSTKEDDSLVPNNVYGITKMIEENLVKMASARSNLDYTILRLTNVYGPEGDQYGAQVMIKKHFQKKQLIGIKKLCESIFCYVIPYRLIHN